MPYLFAKKSVLPFVGFIVIALALGIGFNAWHIEKHRINLPLSGTQLSEPLRIPEFLLTDGSGNPFTNHSLKGHYSFLLFGHTYSQYPMNLLSDLYTQFAQEKLPLPEVVFITLNPKHDGQKVVADYVSTFNPAFKGVTGPLVGIQQLSKQMGIAYTQNRQNTSTTSARNLQNEPNSILYLTNPAGQLIAVFSPPHKKDTIAQSYRALMQTSRLTNASDLKAKKKL